MNVAQRKILQMFLDIVFYETDHMRDGMLISQEADRLVERHRVGGRLFIVATGVAIILHLANLYPDDRFDILATKFWERLRK